MTLNPLDRDDATLSQGLEREVARLGEALAEARAALAVEQQRAREATALLEGRDAVIRERDESLAWARGEVAEVEKARRRAEAVSESFDAQLEAIFNSRAWRWLLRYRRLKERLTRPRGARRRLVPAPEDAFPPADAQAPYEPLEPSPGAPPPDAFEELTLLPRLQHDAAALLEHAPGALHRKPVDVICFSIIDWEFRYQRPQQVMSQFAAHGHRVFYISPSRFRREGAVPGGGARLIKENIYEVQLAAWRTPDIYGEVIGGENRDALLDSLAELRRLYRISTAVVYVMIASWTEMALEVERRWNWPVVYDCMDEWENFQGIKPVILEAETDLVRQCDLVVVTGQKLYDKWRPFGRPMALARNGVDYEFYAARCRPNALLAGTPHPIVGYYGAIADWFDLDLMTRLARERPQYHFVLIGGVFGVDVSALKKLPNVSLLGQQPYSTMPQYLYHFDACLIPFKVNAITEATDPVKLYEYLSAGKPVVSVTLPEIEPYREHLYLAADADDFLSQLDRAVVEDDHDLVARRRTFASQHTWEARYKTISAALVGACRPVSLVVVTYNNLVLTKLCLESILRNTAYPSYELIVVDNASTDGTPEYLRYMASRHKEIRIILNQTNRGFACANNQGLAISRGQYLVLLNNDTIVPPGWLIRLVGHLRDPQIGLVGPVTNFAGNEAKVDVSYRTWREMEHFAEGRGRRHEGLVADIGMLAMFCVAMRRDVYEAIGPLDEQFGVGMFEDDDYTRRLRAAGFRVVCAADTFVHHVGRAAFKGMMSNNTYDSLFEKNRRLYEAKWGVTWTAHRHGQLQWKRHSVVPSAAQVS